MERNHPAKTADGRIRAVVLDCRGLTGDIEIDDFDATLRLRVSIAGMPRPIAEPDIADLIEPDATPLASAGQARSVSKRRRGVVSPGCDGGDGCANCREAADAGLRRDGRRSWPKYTITVRKPFPTRYLIGTLPGFSANH